MFAMRAQKGLKLGSMEWQRANDIVALPPASRQRTAAKPRTGLETT